MGNQRDRRLGLDQRAHDLKDLAVRVRGFDIATAWDWVKPDDSRVRLAVVRFTINGLYIAAINVSDDQDDDGDWYTTISDDGEQCLPFGDYASWSDIAGHGHQIQVVTTWAELI